MCTRRSTLTDHPRTNGWTKAPGSTFGPLTDRITELFPPLAQVEPWDWGETEEGEPVVMIEHHASFTGLDNGDVGLTAPIPNTSMIGVWRIDPSGVYVLMGLMDDPLPKAAAERAKNN